MEVYSSTTSVFGVLRDLFEAEGLKEQEKQIRREQILAAVVKCSTENTTWFHTTGDYLSDFIDQLSRIDNSQNSLLRGIKDHEGYAVHLASCFSPVIDQTRINILRTFITPDQRKAVTYILVHYPGGKKNFPKELNILIQSLKNELLGPLRRLS